MSIAITSSSSRTRTLYWLSAALLFAFLLAGLFDRDPWKADEPYSVGMVLNFFRYRVFGLTPQGREALIRWGDRVAERTLYRHFGADEAEVGRLPL